jgi:methyl-CpG-binding domain protein 4
MPGGRKAGEWRDARDPEVIEAQPLIRTPREISPYNLLQEQLRDHPWRLLVACVMLNQTSAVQVKRVIWDFFERWPDHRRFLEDPAAYETDSDELTDLIRSLGFYNRRAITLRMMTAQFYAWEYELSKDPMSLNVGKIYGVGKYASDSFRMFVGGYIIPGVADKELKNYVRWALGRNQDSDRR